MVSVHGFFPCFLNVITISEVPGLPRSSKVIVVVPGAALTPLAKVCVTEFSLGKKNLNFYILFFTLIYYTFYAYTAFDRKHEYLNFRKLPDLSRVCKDLRPKVE